MSKHTKRQAGRAKTDAPAQNDWVYTCAQGMPTPAIVVALGVEGQPVTEVFAGTWHHDWQMANSFMEAYNYPTAYWFPPGDAVNWDAFEDWILVKQSQSQRTARGRVEGFRFVGELVIVRRSWEAAQNALAILLDVMQAHVDWSRKQYRSRAYCMCSRRLGTTSRHGQGPQARRLDHQSATSSVCILTIRAIWCIARHFCKLSLKTLSPASDVAFLVR